MPRLVVVIEGRACKHGAELGLLAGGEPTPIAAMARLVMANLASIGSPR
jgi:hypothetical protein